MGVNIKGYNEIVAVGQVVTAGQAVTTDQLPEAILSFINLIWQRKFYNLFVSKMHPMTIYKIIPRSVVLYKF